MNLKVSSFGANKYGQCGHPDLAFVSKPKPIEKLKDFNIIQIACGKNHSVFLTDTFLVYACGNNQHGQLGIGNRFNLLSLSFPARIDFYGHTTKKIGCGDNFTVLLNNNGEMYTCGSSEYGQIGKKKFHTKNSK